MTRPDPLIRWETEALRESAARRRHTDSDSGAAARSRRKDAWVTLREAHYETGLPIETLRKWARRNHVPSEIRKTAFGDRRFVDIVAVEQRAETLGRPLHPVPAEDRTAGGSEPHASQDDAIAEPAVVDLREREAAPPDQDEPPEVEPTTEGTVDFTSAETNTGNTTSDTVQIDDVAADVAPAAEGPRDVAPLASMRADDVAPDSPPPGTMIVPIAAWDRMLMQLGNLHEAGQQLAEARERAGKAETEARFLKERVRELREQLDVDQAPRQPLAEPLAPQPRTTPSDESSPGPEAAPEKMWRYILRGWRERHR